MSSYDYAMMLMNMQAEEFRQKMGIREQEDTSKLLLLEEDEDET